MADFCALEVSPDTSLQFVLKRSKSSNSTSILTLKHPDTSKNHIAFKFRTNQPRRYLVSPNQGIVAPNSTESVTITLEKKDKQTLLKSFDRLGKSALDHCKDKFLVQSCSINDDFAKSYSKTKSEVEPAVGCTVNGDTQTLNNVGKELGESFMEMWNAASRADDVSIYNKKLQVRHVVANYPNEIEVLPDKYLHLFLTQSDQSTSTCVMTLKHPGETPNHIAFKVKTNQPLRYLVRPNQGIVAPNCTESVTITLVKNDKQTLLKSFDRFGQSALDHLKDKFLVQSCRVDDDFIKSYHKSSMEIWRAASSCENSSICNKKLQVRYLVARVHDEGDVSKGCAGGDGIEPCADSLPKAPVLLTEISSLCRKYDQLFTFSVLFVALVFV